MDRKNSAPNISRTGLTSRITRPAASVSPITTPMRNAPAAADNPSRVAPNASRKQRPKLATNNVSSAWDLDNMRISRGPSNVPKTNTAMQKIPSFATNHPASARLAEPVVARPARTVSKMTAAKSSTNRMPTMVSPQPERRLPPSRNPFNRMAELLIAMAPPRYNP